MLIETTRFGPLEVEEARVMTFADGLLGFPQHKRLPWSRRRRTRCSSGSSRWTTRPGLRGLRPAELRAGLRGAGAADDVSTLGLDNLTEAQLLVIVNKAGGELTANLLGRCWWARAAAAKQLVLSDKRYGTRTGCFRRPPGNGADGVRPVACPWRGRL